MKVFLKTLLESLNRIEVRGRDNMDYLLGAIVAVEQAIAQLDEQEESEETTDG